MKEELRSEEFFCPHARLPTFTNLITSFFLRKNWLKTAPFPWQAYIFQRTGTIFELNSHWTKNVTSRVFTYINKTNVLTTFHDDWATIVTSRVFTRKTAPPTGGHLFQRTGTTFDLNQHIIIHFDKVT
ncbi:hypothetical protein DPMN_010771 [Dreissena polymorpha]|uniref:Uncharacterized protein n=1 Tax=Dreissena polymorpha TaxID=45954 RepID=A0A9D4MZB7_DREPO|nr:hypothetical protein DPMN_010771 [Dreissena polymorpha]